MGWRSAAAPGATSGHLVTRRSPTLIGNYSQVGSWNSTHLLIDTLLAGQVIKGPPFFYELFFNPIAEATFFLCITVIAAYLSD